ncbi:zinc-dependent alcohol dehydrogenase family protein [Marinobacterium rhizophilum]|uniref:zinc-dependent alcohol dehydrogenase family protein n=1 Tax=Marinobacterium rhizophilum TaxID=420402 RepID=UPI00036FCBF4|nr:zinc-dependent alcohol dehydrogenase family protein [Marinobacterium rhizophilum]
MNAMLLEKLMPVTENATPLRLVEWPEPQPGPQEVLLQVSACGVCHTELDEIEGRTPPTSLPRVLGHQAVGRVIACGSKVTEHQVGDRLGVGWIASSCGNCPHCQAGDENLCAEFHATGRDIDGGYAQSMVIDQHFAYPVPDQLTDVQAAPLLCAGAIGYRSLRLSGLQNGQRLGLTGFGASAHLVLQLARHQIPDSDIYIFARNPQERRFALSLGACWAGDTLDKPPRLLDAIIDTTPVWTPIVAAMKCLAPGGRLVINAIRKEDADKSALLQLDYPSHLWMEKEIKSVANVARRDVSEFLQLAVDAGIDPEIELFDLADANRALIELKTRRVRGAKVLQIA